MRRLLLFPLMILVFSLTGCRRGDISIDPDAGTLGLSISETDLNAGLMTLIAAHSNPLFRNPSLDLQPGLVVLNGEHQRRDGQGMVTGSVTLRPSVVEGGIQVAVEQVSVEGVNADDAQVQAFADDFAKLLNNQSALRQRRASITAFTVTDSTLDITFSR